ncbi:unnamed protein product [Soboliphyme baturini]|uniref:Endo/exonuclease/phosphatase domain-containing protein n=1 Tax=Soboliphyme baturini TaxID=241478 RepID=A0A183IKK0_9BILA|nr:unnamed protein product [Soboliphyme baturini]
MQSSSYSWASLIVDNEKWNGAIGINGPSDLNNNGMKLLRFRANNGLSIVNTSFEHRKVHQYTWYRDACAQKSMIDLIIVSSDLRRSVMDIRVKRGAELSTDHHLVVGTLRCKKWSTIRRSGGRSNRRIKWETLSSVDTRAKFAINIARRFEQIPAMTIDVETEWRLFKRGLLQAAAECCGYKRVRLPPGDQKRSSWWT